MYMILIGTFWALCIAGTIVLCSALAANSKEGMLLAAIITVLSLSLTTALCVGVYNKIPDINRFKTDCFIRYAE